MRIDIACFTERGQTLGESLAEKLRAENDEARCTRCGGNKPVTAWTAENFPATNALVFIGATGIVVRAVAPQLRGKTTDPAVVVIDDTARFAISLLSGHLGGANALAARLAEMIGATPVITTATDNAGVFAVDIWAQEHGLFIANPERIKHVSARALAGLDTAADITIDIFRRANEEGNDKTLHLVPRRAVLGIGCRKDTPQEALERAFHAFCEQTNLHPQAFAKVCSIDLKRNEPGLAAFCNAHALPFETFPAETLARQSGAFTGSDFVSAVTGVDNVCERAAAAGSEGGTLLITKTVIDRIAFAAAAHKEEPA